LPCRKKEEEKGRRGDGFFVNNPEDYFLIVRIMNKI